MDFIEKKHLDQMVQMIGHTEENGMNVVSRYVKPLTAIERCNVALVEDTFDETLKLAQKEQQRLCSQNPEKEYDMQHGDSVMDDGSMMFWYIISERL